LSVEEYPLLTPEELVSTLSAGKIFSKLDLSQAYIQLPIEDNSKPYLTINTHQGFIPTIVCLSAFPQLQLFSKKLTDTVLQGIPGVCCYIDDILVSASDKRTHLCTLEQVLLDCLLMVSD